ncbi:MAG: hypothetical protein D6705_13325 [Deltaproteobacteria bacterium]|nr:MAG: hypothetical protein D6705_13325 [Deltaproteobacteria bacterium]
MVEDLAAFEDALNVYVRLADDDPARGAYRGRLLAFLVEHGRTAADEGDEGEVRRTLEHIARLFRATELRAAGPLPEVSALARIHYRTAGRQGDAAEALFALAFRQHFGSPEERKRAVDAWQRAEHWLVEVSPTAGDPALRHETLERAFDATAAILPTPFVVRRTSELYLSRYREAKAAVQGGVAGSLEARRAEFTPILVLRLYLRADDPATGLALVDDLELDAPARKMVEIVRRSVGKDAKAEDLLALAEQFAPGGEDDADLPESYLRQGAAIAENLVRRAIAADPRNASAHFFWARLLTLDDLVDAAIAEVDEAIRLSPNVEHFWEAGAVLRTERVERRAGRGPEAGEAALRDLEAFLARAKDHGLGDPAELLAAAHAAVGQAYVREGRPADAVAHLEAAREGPTAAEALEALGAVYRHLGRRDRAKDAYASLRALELDDPMAEARSEVRAMLGLADLAEDEGDRTQAMRLRTEALAVLDTVQQRWMRQIRGERAPWGTPEDHAELFILRGKITLSLGFVDQAIKDFRMARRLAPGSPAVYADALVELLLAGRSQEALEVYREALARRDLPKDLKLYFSLWVYFLGRDTGGEPPKAAQTYLASYRGRGWDAKLAAFALGRLSPAELQAAAKSAGERTEAIFYAALARAQGAGAADVEQELARVVESGLLGFFEYDMARRMLAHRGGPAAHRVTR